MKESKIFSQAKTETEVLAKTLTDVAKGVDVHNENFVAQLEKLLNEPISNDLKPIIAKLNSVAKQKLAVETQAAAERIALDAEYAAAKAGISTQKFMIDQQAQIRDFMRTAVYHAIGYVIVSGVIYKIIR